MKMNETGNGDQTGAKAPGAADKTQAGATATERNAATADGTAIGARGAGGAGGVTANNGIPKASKPQQPNKPTHNNQTAKNAGAKGQDNTPTAIGHYQVGKFLGKGTFGQVKLGLHQLTGEKVAIKILEKDKIHDQKDVERITREIKILKKVRHPNVIQLYEIIETEKELYMIMEYANGGELFDYIVRHTRLSEKQACKFYLELISGIEYIHQSGVCHRDLKPENLLLDYDLTLKIVDFGLSNMYEPAATLKTACGSPCYAAPEMIAGKRYHGLRTDIWSSGVVFYAMVCGYLPFEDPKTANLYKKIMGAEYTLPKFLSGQCKDLIRKILNTDPETRYTVNDIRSHTWSLQVKDRNRDMGLFPGKEKMPIEDKLLNKILEDYNLDKKYSIKCIEDNRHNHITACYHLIDKRNKKIKDRNENYSQSKIDFKKKMKIGPKEEMNTTVDVKNRTSVTSPNQKVDLNMTAPLNSEQLKQGRKIVNEFVGANINPTKVRGDSVNYNTIQADSRQQQERIAYQRRAQTRGNGGPTEASKSPDKYTINKNQNLVVDLNSTVTKPVKRENSNTTNTTHITGVTASTMASVGQNPAAIAALKNNAFYNTQYKGNGQFFNDSNAAASEISKASDKNKNRNYIVSPQNGNADGANSVGGGKPGSVHSRFRSIQNPPSNNNSNKASLMQTQNIQILHQNQQNTSIDVNQLPMRLMNQSKGTSRGAKGRNINGIINNTAQTPSGSQQATKNAWQSVDAGSRGHDETPQIGSNGLMIQPCSNQVNSLVSGPAKSIDMQRPSVTQGGTNSQGGQRSPRGQQAQVRGQFYAVHGRGMSIQGNGTHGIDANGKGFLTKIFKNQHTRQAAFHPQNYVDHMNMTHGQISVQSRGGHSNNGGNIIAQIKSPGGNLREHLHTQGRSRGQNQTLEPGPGVGQLGNHNRGGSLNIQELYSHYQKGAISNPGRNVTYYSNKNQGGGHQHLDQQTHNNNYINQTAVQSPANTNAAGQNIFVPGSMRFAVMNPRSGPNGHQPQLTPQQQKLFEMNNHQHQVGPMNYSGGKAAGGTILPPNVQTTNNFINRKKISTQQQNRSHSVNNQ